VVLQVLLQHGDQSSAQLPQIQTYCCEPLTMCYLWGQQAGLWSVCPMILNQLTKQAAMAGTQLLSIPKGLGCHQHSTFKWHVHMYVACVVFGVSQLCTLQFAGAAACCC
jgi:hypothetical protein